MLLPSNTWSETVENELNKETIVVLQSIANLNSDGSLDVHIFTEFIANFSDQLNLSILIVESELHGAQLDYYSEPNYVENYEYTNLLRDAINGTTGEVLGSNFISGTTIQNDYVYQINPNWINENCSIIAFVYNPTTGYILNSIEQNIN